MGNLALHSAEEPDNLRATIGTVEVSRSPRKEIMMLRSRQEPDLFNSTSPRHVTDELEKASTHKSVKTYASTVFMPRTSTFKLLTPK